MFLEETGKKPTGLKVDKVFHNNVEVPFRSYQIFQYKRINSDKDKAKIVIGLWNPGPLQEVELEIQFKEKQFRQYFSLKDGSSMKDN